MNELLAKFSSYNIFNYLFPGVVFCYAAERFTSVRIFTTEVSESILVRFFVYYFIGLLISRVGSVVIEPCLMHIRLGRRNPETQRRPALLSREDYKDYQEASHARPFIITLSEITNMYRSVLSMMICIGLWIFLFGEDAFHFSNLSFGIGPIGIVIYFVIIILLNMSFIKQNNYVSKRVRAYIVSKSNSDHSKVSK